MSALGPLSRAEVGATVFTATWTPDIRNAIDVLGFLLCPARLFVDERDDIHTRRDVENMLYEAKRDALLRWHQYAKRSR